MDGRSKRRTAAFLNYSAAVWKGPQWLSYTPSESSTFVRYPGDSRHYSCVISDSRHPSCVIGDSRPLSCIFIEFEPAQILLAGHEEFSPVLPTLAENCKKLSCNSREGMRLSTSFLCCRLARVLREVPLNK